MKTLVSRIWGLLSEQERAKLRPILLLILIVSLLELIVIGAMVPVLLMFIDPPRLLSILNALGFSNSITKIDFDSLMWWVISLFSGVLIIKTALSLILAYSQAKYVHLTQVALSKRVLGKLVNRSLVDFHSSNSSYYLQIVVNETNAFTHLALIPMTILLTEISALILITASILIIQPIETAVVMILFCGPGLIYYFVTRVFLVKLGGIKIDADERKLGAAKELFGAIREIKLYRASTFFIENFTRHAAKSAETGYKLGFVHAFPRYMFEFLSIGSIIATISIFLLLEVPVSDIITSVGIFAAAAFRLLPSVNRIFASTGNLKFSQNTVNILHRLMSEAEAKPNELNQTVKFENSLELRGFAYKYVDSENYCFKNLNLTIRQGDIVSIVGDTGSGKSTLIELIAGLNDITDGKLYADETEVDPKQFCWQRRIAYVPQDVFIIDGTFRENIIFGSSNVVNEKRLLRAIRIAELESVVAQKRGLDYRVGENGANLSGGQKQRLGLARALYAEDKDILILDEATSALDSDTELLVLRNIKEFCTNLTVLMITHRSASIEVSDYSYKLPEGLVVG